MEKIKPNILVVDDSKASLALIQDLLSSFNVNIFTSSSALLAMNIIQNYRIDIIISDVNMPDMDGFAFARSIRAKEKYANIPLVFISGSLTSSIYQNFGLELGAIDYILKSDLEFTLPQKIRNILELVNYQSKLSVDFNRLKQLHFDDPKNCDGFCKEYIATRESFMLQNQLCTKTNQEMKTKLYAMSNEVAALKENFDCNAENINNLYNSLNNNINKLYEIIENNSKLIEALTGKTIITNTLINLEDLISHIINTVNANFPRTTIGTFYKNISRAEFMLDPVNIKLIVENMLTFVLIFSEDASDVKLCIEETERKLLFSINFKTTDNNYDLLNEDFYFQNNYKNSKSEFTSFGFSIGNLKHLVKAIKGEINIENVNNSELKFTITIPLLSEEK